MQHRIFTLQDANGLLPWLERTFARLAPVQQQLTDRQRQLMELLRERQGNGSAGKHNLALEVQQAVDELGRQLQESLTEITGEGILVRDVSRGLVDFPSIRDGREVYLCWVLGEEEIGFWHETNTGFSSRQAI